MKIHPILGYFMLSTLVPTLTLVHDSSKKSRKKELSATSEQFLLIYFISVSSVPLSSLTLHPIQERIPAEPLGT
jgi:hypothetical protein